MYCINVSDTIIIIARSVLSNTAGKRSQKKLPFYSSWDIE